MSQTVGRNRCLLILLSVAFSLRLALALYVQHEVSKTPGQLCLIKNGGDAEGYWELAGRIAKGEKYEIFYPPRQVMRMPGFPALLAIPRILFGDRPDVARFLLVFVGTAACGLTYWLGRELVGPIVGCLACAYTAVSPILAVFSTLFLSETPFALAMLASLIGAARLIRKPPVSRGTEPTTPPTALVTEPRISRSIWLSLLTGALIGLATYMRPTWFLVGPGLSLLVILMPGHSYANRLVIAVGLCTGLALMLSPWTYRNYQKTGHPIPTTLWVGASLYDGLNPTATGDSDMKFFEDDRLMDRMTEYDMDREYRRRAWAFAFQNPTRALWLAGVKQLRFWSPSPQSAQFDRTWMRLVAWLAYLPLIGFALVGAWFSRGDLWRLILTAAPLLYFAAIHLLFVGSLRYRLPAEYPLAVLSAVGISRTLKLRDVESLNSLSVR